MLKVPSARTNSVVVGSWTGKIGEDGNMATLNWTVKVCFTDKIQFDQRPEELKAEKGHSEGCKEVQRARIFQAEGRESRRWVQNKPWREQYDRAEVRREAIARRKIA